MLFFFSGDARVDFLGEVFFFGENKGWIGIAVLVGVEEVEGEVARAFFFGGETGAEAGSRE